MDLTEQTDLMEQVDAILGYGEICDHCLGRFFGKLSYGLTNAERGHALRVSHALSKNLPYQGVSPEACWICGGFMGELAVWAERVAESLSGIGHDTFLLGSRVPPLISESEEMVWSDLSLGHPEPFKAEMNREVGKLVSAITGVGFDTRNPDVVVIMNLGKGVVEVQVTPVFFAGRYMKYERGIPQTHWDCRVCRGEGCERCNFTGRMYLDSVEELIGRPVIEAMNAEGAILHGAGREDIDARMLGSGRPFIMEMVSPHIRRIDLTDLEEEINRCAEGRVAVALTGWSQRGDVETLKSNKAYKKYRILVGIDGHVTPDDLKSALDRLKGVVIHQRTPERVLHRRADKVRERRVIDIDLAGVEEDRFFIDIVGEAGLYIKELVSGDGGRTRPSLAEVIGRGAQVITLDVLQVGVDDQEDQADK